MRPEPPTVPALPPPLTEAALQRAAEALLEVCRRRGLIVEFYHRPDRGAGHNERPGFPDLAIKIRVDEGLYSVELKKNCSAARLTEAQRRWQDPSGRWSSVCRTLAEFRAALLRWGVDTHGIGERT